MMARQWLAAVAEQDTVVHSMTRAHCLELLALLKKHEGAQRDVATAEADAIEARRRQATAETEAYNLQERVTKQHQHLAQLSNDKANLQLLLDKALVLLEYARPYLVEAPKLHNTVADFTKGKVVVMPRKKKRSARTRR